MLKKIENLSEQTEVDAFKNWKWQEFDAKRNALYMKQNIT